MHLATPRGVKDFLPDDAYWKRHLEGSLGTLFARWGYREVVTPTFEHVSALDLGGAAGDQMFKFLDRSGQLLALRPDLTTPIARMVATSLRSETKPLRLSYLANVFRYDDVQVGRQREFYQAGVELIGSARPAADAEVAALAAEALAATGVQGYELDLGHVQFFQGLMEECTCPNVKEKVRQALLRKDHVGLKSIVGASSLPADVKRLLIELPRWRGQAEVLARAEQLAPNQTAKQAVENLRQIYSVLEDHGVADRVYIDLSMVKSLDYYTGMVLEGFAPDLGFTLCTGGRYDNLTGRFAAEHPAVGFALGLERLMLVLERQGGKPPLPPIDMLVIGENWPQMLSYAQEQRRQGKRVELDLEGLNETEARDYAAAKGIHRVIKVTSAGEGIPC